jgi:small subunit ribosomal protein S4
MKLFLKGERCYGTKCSIERRGYAPGQHGQRQRKVSDYGLRLREKQKVKHMYGLQETQFRNYFIKAAAARGITGEVLIQSLERRLDNVAYRCGYAGSRREARQLVLHGTLLVNGKAVNIPSYLVRKDDRVEPVSGHKRTAAMKKRSKWRSTAACRPGSNSTGTSSSAGSSACRAATGSGWS